MNPKKRNMLPYLACTALLCLTMIGLVALEKVVAVEALSEAKAYYIVREGDTLWDITENFYEDPYLWPAVWGTNPHISNPHWIYPGDPIYLASIAGQYLADVADVASGPETPAVRPVASVRPTALSRSSILASASASPIPFSSAMNCRLSRAVRPS